MNAASEHGAPGAPPRRPGTVGHFIGGRRIAGTGATSPVYDPTTGERARETIARWFALLMQVEVERRRGGARRVCRLGRHPPVHRAPDERVLALMQRDRDRLQR